MPHPIAATLFAPLLLCLLLHSGRAQDDLRDTVRLKKGRVVTGRVVTPFAPRELLIVQGGKRIRVERADIAELQLLATDVREFCQRRLRHQSSPRALRYLVDWAVSKRLDNLAKLQAMELILQDHDDDRLRELLGHRKRGGNWRWPHGSKFLTVDKLEKAMLTRPLQLEGERFRLQSDAGLLPSVRALLDLEQLGTVWFERFGDALQAKEVLDPIDVRTYRNVSEFPKWGFRPQPYFEPPPHDDIGRTFYAGPTPKRPERLFFLGTQGLLYRGMIGEVNAQSSRDRACAWLEIGLGMHMQDLMQGPAGFARPEPPKRQGVKAMQSLGRSYRLTHLLQLPMYGSFYLTNDTATLSNWDAATMFTAYLLDEDNQPKTRASFLRYIRAALADRQGSSSSAFDREMGRRIEEFEEPWRKWLGKIGGF